MQANSHIHGLGEPTIATYSLGFSKGVPPISITVVVEVDSTMAKRDRPQGFQCEFKDSIREDLYCKKCNLVARRLTITNCCGESFCHACIEESRVCPACGAEDYNTFDHVKNRRLINCLPVYCSMKERVCDWSGTLEQLDTHLDPDQDNCQYVDTKCPLNCHMTVPKNKVEQHVAQHCAKRPYVCQHCNFKATYEEVVDTHLPECKYVPLQCPNLCGVTFERDFMEDHMKMCRLVEVGCEFSDVGCDGRFRREDQEEHTRQNSQKHLTLTASLAVETKKQLQQKLLEQDKKHKEEEEKLKQQVEEKKKRIDVQEKKLVKQEQDLYEQKMKLIAQSRNIQEMEERLMKQQKNLQAQLSELSNRFGLNRTFTMPGFSKAKDEAKSWNSPAMYTHAYGYKFNIKVMANGLKGGHGRAIHVTVVSMPGIFDNQLQWPAKVKFELELINQQGGSNMICSVDGTWNKPGPNDYIATFGKKYYSGSTHLIDHSELYDYLTNDSLYFIVSTTV